METLIYIVFGTFLVPIALAAAFGVIGLFIGLISWLLHNL
ncbi:Uncharacterised protein [Actinobacillus equuli]|nr:Uncharacterised protein [Actinobacillus equuli]